MNDNNKMPYLRQADANVLEQTLNDWQGRFPKMGICAFLPEAQKENVSVLQSSCAKKNVPLVGGNFPFLVVDGNFETEGIWLLRFDVMPSYALHADLPTDIKGAERKSRDIAQKGREPFGGRG
jgi:hypothetical protein